MSTILRKGIIRNGQVIVAEPINLPDGSEVTISGEFLDEEDDDRPPTPEEIAASLAAMEKVEPFAWTEQERSAWEAERKARKEWEKAHFTENAEKLRSIWE
jgi:hypothetical protein